MYYTSQRDLMNAVIQWSDDTNVTLYTNSSEREERISHYMDRAIELCWNARTWWPFRHGTTILTLSAGQAALPDNFGGIGEDGYVVLSGSNNLPWVEVDYQELIAIRRNRVWPARFQNQQVFAIGPPVPSNPVTVSDGTTSNASGSSYRLTSAGNLPSDVAPNMRVEIAGFTNSGNNGEFIVTDVITANNSWDVTRVDGGAVGATEGPVSITVAVAMTDQLSLLSGNAEDARTIDVYYNVQVPNIDPNWLDRPVPVPGYLHHAVLAAAIWYAARSKNDAREEEFRRDFMKTLSDAIRVGRRTAHRPDQLPMSVGRMW
jgi:hypothetical protein